jgi:hypothetical protein
VGFRIEVFLDHYRTGTPDREWLPLVGGHRWTLLTLDARLRYNRLERDAILANKLAAIVLVGKKVTHAARARAVANAKTKLDRLVRSEPRPFIAKLYLDGTLRVWLPSRTKP